MVNLELIAGYLRLTQVILEVCCLAAIMVRLASQQLAVLVAELIKQFTLEALLEVAARFAHMCL